MTGDKVQIGFTKDGEPVVDGVETATRPDDEPVLVQTITSRGQVYAVPDDALPLLREGVLDWDLFNLAKLADWAAEGRTGQTPTIETYIGTVNARTAEAAAGTTAKTVLASINGRATAIDDDGQWWREVRQQDTGRSLAATRAAGPLAGVKKVWLDPLLKVQLDQSVPQIGAPAAWSRGFDGTGVTVAVLDGGVDATHPDLSGRIDQEVDFTGSANGPVDGFGHGTHVADTIAGTGAASGGRYKGVAPGAKVAIGKICLDDGTCPGDAIAAGMEWAAKSGYRVANMSIGSSTPSDGTDPLSQEVNQLSRTYGTLFVVAAGNNGRSGGTTIGSPGAADDALTVAAVDKSDQMADFSSRGPRLHDGAAKPDIAAPGVDIVAARAKGTSLGTPVNEYYTSLSGTSMATPHVAGAAAIIAEQHPDFTGQQIKALLMATSKDLGFDIYAQGSGRVDLDRGTDPKIVPTGSLNFGRTAYPHSPVARTVTYSNWTDQPITLALSASATSAASGGPAPAGLISVSADQVTVPANGSADVTVTVDGSVLGDSGSYGGYSGALTAKDGSGKVLGNSRISAFLEPVMHDLTISVIPPDGATDIKYGDELIVPMDGDKLHLYDTPVTVPGGATATARVFSGTVAAGMAVTWRDASGRLQKAAPLAPQVAVSGDTTVVLDLRKAKPVMVETPEPTETYQSVTTLRRASADGGWAINASLATAYGPEEPHWWVLPTGKVSSGTLTFSSQHVLVPPSVTMKATGQGNSLDLGARYPTPDATVTAGNQIWTEDGKAASRLVRLPIPRLPDHGRKRVVYAGTGSDAELAKVDAKGALVLLRPTDICTATCDFTALRHRVTALAAAGASGVLVTGESDPITLPTYLSLGASCKNGPDSCPPVDAYTALPIVTVAPGAAATLIQRLGSAGQDGVLIRLGGNREVSKDYALAFATAGQVPSSLPYRVRSSDLDQVDHRIHADQPGTVPYFSWTRTTASGRATPAMNLPKPPSQRQITTLVGPRDDNAVDHFELSVRQSLAPFLASGSGPSEAQDLALDRRNTIEWNAGPTIPGAVPQARTKSGVVINTNLPCAACRDTDEFWPNLYTTSSAGGRQAVFGIVDDPIGIPSLLWGMATCAPPDCDVDLLDAAGHTITKRLIPATVYLGIGADGTTTNLVSEGQR
ncbi:S8 family peptidase [Streptomyces sp. NPDC020917]|uniref:S8 family peptidase n=1 Tax=Streptomyces sp. NPDC020917 TaxID=3365102 RepID=UPI00379B7BCE